MIMKHNSFTYISSLLPRNPRGFRSGFNTHGRPQAILCTLLLLGSLLLSGCVKDMQDELNEGAGTTSVRSYPSSLRTRWDRP